MGKWCHLSWHLKATILTLTLSTSPTTEIPSSGSIDLPLLTLENH